MSHLCTNCHSVRLVRTTKDIHVLVGTSSEIVPAVNGWHCPDCDAVVLSDADDSSKHMDMPGNKLSPALTKQAAFIQDVRVKLGLTLQQAEEIFGGAEGSFSKYERMEAFPPRTIVHLLRILEKYPELLPEMRGRECEP